MPMQASDFAPLLQFLDRAPATRRGISHGTDPKGCWWIKFQIDIAHPHAWHLVQEMGHVLNYLSLGERLPTTFFPVSPPPPLNGGPREFLSWVLECASPEFTPAECAEWLSGRLPRPVEDDAAWAHDDDDVSP